MAKKIELSKEVIAAGYQVTGKPVSSRFMHPKHGEINLRTMTPKQAKALVAGKFPYLKETGKASKP